jgi:hypothetical protein
MTGALMHFAMLTDRKMNAPGIRACCLVSISTLQSIACGTIKYHHPLALLSVDEDQAVSSPMLNGFTSDHSLEVCACRRSAFNP